jgi:hypothetical protein
MIIRISKDHDADYLKMAQDLRMANIRTEVCLVEDTTFKNTEILETVVMTQKRKLNKSDAELESSEEFIRIRKNIQELSQQLMEM